MSEGQRVKVPDTRMESQHQHEIVRDVAQTLYDNWRNEELPLRDRVTARRGFKWMETEMNVRLVDFSVDDAEANTSETTP
jgi:hypothetical protein